MLPTPSKARSPGCWLEKFVYFEQSVSIPPPSPPVPWSTCEQRKCPTVTLRVSLCRRCLEGQRAGRAGGCHGAGPRSREIAEMAAWGRRPRAQTWPSPSPTSWQPGGTSTAGSSSRWMSTAPTPHRLSRSTTLTRDASSPRMCKCKYYSAVIAPAQPSEWLLPCRCGIPWTSHKEFKERCIAAFLLIFSIMTRNQSIWKVLC